MRKILTGCLLIGGLCLGSCSEALKPQGEGTFILGNVEESFVPNVVVNLGLGLEYLMVAAQPEPPIGPTRAPSQATLLTPAPNPATDTVKLRFTLEEEVPDHVLVVESSSRQLPGILAEWSGFAVGSHEVNWDLKDKFTGGFLPNGLYFVRLLDGNLESLAETRLFINRPGQEAVVFQAFITFTDGNGDFVIEDIPVGETFIAADASGTTVGNRKPKNQVLLFNDDAEYHFQEVLVDISPNEGVQLQVTVDPKAFAPQPIEEIRTP